MILSTEHFNFCALSTALAVVSLPFISCVFSEAHAGSELSCASVFQFNSEKSQEPELQSHTQKQANQFIQLLIDSQSEGLSPSQRQTRLADAQRVFLELTQSQPEIAELIQAEWRNLHSGSESATESKRTKLISEIQTREQQLLMLTLQSQQLSEWEIVRDSATDAEAQVGLPTLLKNQNDLIDLGTTLEIRSYRYINVSLNGGPNELDARGPEGHTGQIWGAKLLPGGKVLSWSADHTLILWRLVDIGYVVQQRLGVESGNDPDIGHCSSVNGVHLFPDLRLLSWSADHTLILWKLVDDTYLIDQRLGVANSFDLKMGHTAGVYGALKLPDEKILSWSYDQTLILWKLVNDTYVIDQRVGEQNNADPKRGHIKAINGGRVWPDGTILSWSTDHTLIFWKLVHGAYVIDHRLGVANSLDPNKGHTDWINRAELLPDGRIVSSDKSDRYLLWQGSAPGVIQTENEKIEGELIVLKGKLAQLEIQWSSSDEASSDSGR